ncbi:MAG: LysM peptidoglycan-binding domain-containing protein [Desulfobacterales bacterium]
MQESQKTRVNRKTIRGSRRDRRWALLFIGENSRTVAFNHLKAAILIILLVVLALGGLSAWLVHMRQGDANKITALENRLAEMNHAMLSLRDEKDILMARKVLRESKNSPPAATAQPAGEFPAKPEADVSAVRESEPAVSSAPMSPDDLAPKPPASESTVYHTVAPGDSLYTIGFRYNVSVPELRRLNHMEEGAVLHPGERLVVSRAAGEEGPKTGQIQPADGAPAETAQPAASVAGSPETAIGADIRNFTSAYEPENKALRVEYVIRNDGSKSQQISGQTVVILKGAEDDPDNWLVLPPVPIVSGKPDGKQGSAFSIFNFRTIRFKATDQQEAGRYTRASVYVFSTNGNLVLEKEFPVSPGQRPSQ